MNKIKNAFDTVKADEKLKKNTILFLQNERAKREKRPKFRYAYRYAAVLTAVFAVSLGAGSHYILNTSVSYISIDVNPSVELSLNRFDNVVEAAAYNDDGEAILKNVDLNGKSYTDAIDILLSNQEFTSYIQNDGEIDFTVVSDNENRIINGIQGCKGYRQYNTICHGADDEIVSQAHKHGLSVGKYRAYLELSEYNSSFTADDCKNMTMRQICNLIEEHKNEHHSDNDYSYNNYSSNDYSHNEHSYNNHSQSHHNGHH